MRKALLLALLIIVLAFTGCNINDPLRETLYCQEVFVVEGGHLGRYMDDETSGYYHEYNMPAIELSPGGSGATQIIPTANTLGGYQLNAIDEYLYYTTHIEDDWDTQSDMIFEITFETNVNNAGGNPADVVIFNLLCLHKSEGSAVVHQNTDNGSTTIGTAGQYTLFKQNITLDYITEGYINGDTISYRLNLDTVNSDISNVIVNYVELKYKSLYPALEVE